MSAFVSPQDVIRAGICIGCGSCVAQSNAPDTQMTFDRYGQLKPASPQGLHLDSEVFARTCPFSPAAANEDDLGSELFPASKTHDSALGHYETAYVGYVAEKDFRMQGSSGGMVSWVASELLRKKMVDAVAHVVAIDDPQVEGRFFRYQLSRTEAEIRAGAKSQYYPVEMSEVLKKIRRIPGRYAIVGIPCFIKAVQLLRREDPVIRERIRFTLGLFCGHMKSARFIESFAWQMKVPLQDVVHVEFRHKDPNRPANWYNARLTLRDGRVVNKDWWHLADGDWGAGFFMNKACNYCDDVVAETADVSFGDAWVEPYASDGRGTNVVVTRSSAIQALVSSAIQDGRLQLSGVNSQFVKETQAAGFRQRREGLAYRLTWGPKRLKLRKRIAPDAKKASPARKRVYLLRYLISAWAHRIFWVSRLTHCPQLYILWARIAAAVYHSLAYHRGKIGEMMKRLRLQ